MPLMSSGGSPDFSKTIEGINEIKSLIKELKKKKQTGNQTKTDDKLSKLQKKIEEEKLEAERRKAVVETKVYGAEIEVITTLRNELKRRDENNKEISELKSRMDKIEKLLTDYKGNQPQEHQEDKTLISILQVPETANLIGNNEKREAVEIYDQIKALREEVALFERQVENSNINSSDKSSLLDKILTKQSEITKLQKSLSRIGASPYMFDERYSS